MPQDLPPSGGYDPIQYKRNIPARGFRPVYYLVAMGTIMTYGFYKVGVGIREQNELAREKMWARIHLIPMLQAEVDRDTVRRHLADLAREKELLGTETSAYNSDRYVYTSLRTTDVRCHTFTDFKVIILNSKPDELPLSAYGGTCMQTFEFVILKGREFSSRVIEVYNVAS
ncbi:hypothetical protein MMC14_001765 [Varicellaria rhodocarpa]|nr:hypothetical protein [Varicellaria rhodocarpa]